METKELDNEYVAHSYGRFNTALSKGKGSTVYDESGKEYIDFGSGIGVTAFGLCDNEWKAAVEMQLDKMQVTFTTQSLAQSLQKCYVTKQI